MDWVTYISTQLLTLQKLTPQFLDSSFADCNPCNSSQSIGESVAEWLQLFHIEAIVLQFLPIFLVLLNLSEHLFIMLALRDGGGLVFPILLLRDHEAYSSSRFTRAGRAADAVEVRLI